MPTDYMTIEPAVGKWVVLGEVIDNDPVMGGRRFYLIRDTDGIGGFGKPTYFEYEEQAISYANACNVRHKSSRKFFVAQITGTIT